jgi:hypothetical protein
MRKTQACVEGFEVAGVGEVAEEWVPCGSSFIEADLVRWTEGVWEKPPRRPKGKAVHIGERVVIAQILKLDGDWVEFVVLGGSIASEKSG